MKSMYEKFPGVILAFVLGVIFITSIGEAMAQAPTGAATNLSFTDIDGDRFRVNFTRGNGDRRIIVASENPITALPVNGADYLAGNYGLGNQIGPGQFVVYSGTAQNITLTGYNHSTTYHIRIYEYNGSNFNTEYLTSEFLEGSITTLSAPTAQVSNLVFSNITGSSLTLGWTNGEGGTGRIVIGRANSPVGVEPQDLTNYSSWGGAFGSNSYNISNSEHKVLYMGTASSVSVSSLAPNTTYHFAVFEYNGSSGKVYLRPGAKSSQITASTPTTSPTGLTFSNRDGDRFYYNFSGGNGNRRLVIAKKGSPVTSLPQDGISYSSSTTFGSGQEISEGEFVVYNGTGSASWLNGLEAGTTYHLAVFEFNQNSDETFYLTDPFLTSSYSTFSHPTDQAHTFSFTNITGTGMRVGWTNGDGGGRILIGRAGSPVEVEPQDLTNYSSWAGAFGSSSYNIGNAEHKVLYVGGGSVVNISNLTSNTTYYFAVFEYNGSNGRLYLRPGLTGSQKTTASPTTAPTNILFSNKDGDRFYYNFTSGDGGRRLVIAKKDSPVTALPVDGISYTSSSTFGSGHEISEGEFVVYNGTGSASWLNGLEAGTTYHLAVFEFNQNSDETFYLIDPFLTSSYSTFSHPTDQAHTFSFTNITGTSMRVGWTNGDGGGRILIGRAGSPVEVEPQDLTNYSSWAGAFGSSSYNIGNAEHKVLYVGGGSAVNISNLTSNTTYYFAVFDYNGSNGRLYLRPGATGSQATSSYPSTPATNMQFSNRDGDRFYYSFSSGNGGRRIVIAKKDSPVTALPVDDISYTANSTFGSGQEIAEGEFVVFNGNGSASWLNGLQAGTTYHLAVFEYNQSGEDIFYLTDPFLASSYSTFDHPTVQSSNAFTSSRSNTSINVSWTRGGGANRILIGRKDGPVNVEPQDLTTYSTSSNFGTSWTQIGTGNYGLYAGSGNNVNVTNLEPGTNYYFALFEYNGSSGRLYLRPGYQFALETLGERPTVQVSNAGYSNIEFNSFDVSFTPGNGSRRLVLARQGGPVNAGPADFSIYEANSTFGSGAQIGTGNFVVYNGFGSNFHLDGLEPATTYHFAFYEYSFSEQGELYLAPPYTSVQASKAYFDLGISGIISPQSGCELSESEPITIEIKNFSSSGVEALQAGYSINGSEPIIESISGANLVPGNGTITHTFASTENLSEKGSYEITAFLILEDDINEDNDSFTAMVMHHPEMETSISDDVTICQGESVLLTATGGSSYRWSTNATAASITVSPASTTQYSVTITNAVGCEKVETVTVTVNPAPVLSFAGDQGFTGSYVAPAIGSEETEFTFRVKYTDGNGIMPAAGYPRVEMDSNNNGVVTDPTDLIISMQEEDPADTDVTDGKIYVATVAGLSDQINWKTRIHAVTTEGCVAKTSFVTAPLLSDDLLDIAIFANNITFSNGAPAVNEVIGIQARVNNLSDFPAENFVVSAYSEDNQIFTTTVGNLAPKSNVVLNWDYSFSEPGFYPIKVVIDETNVLNEVNELNNFAIRPVLVGDFELPGGIEITAEAHKTTYYPGETVRISGYANYYGIEEGVNPIVAGATVTLNLQSRPSRTVNTRSNGYYETTFTAPSSPGEYLLSGQITDYTLTATIEAFDVIVIPRPPKPDLVSSIQLSQNTILQGETVSGTATVTNIGQETATNFIFRYVSCEEVLGEQLIESLDPGQSLSFNFQANPSVVGDCFNRNNCLFNAFADFTRVVDESNENNNSANTNLTVLPNLPDLTPEKSSAPFSYTSINNTFNINVRVDNIGGIAAGGSFIVNVYEGETLIESRTYEDLLPCNSLSFTMAFQPTEPKDYVFSIKVDEPIGSGSINEYREGNNVWTKTVLFRPPVLKPNLNIRLRDVVITPVNPAPGQIVEVKAPYRNNGNDDVNSPYTISYTLQDGESTATSNVRIQETLAIGGNSSATYSATNNGPAMLSIALDSENEIDESSESDNLIILPLCWDFSPAQSGSIWSGNFYINTNQTFSASIRNLGLYTAENVKVRFLIDNVEVGVVVIPTVNTTLFTSGYQVSIPYVFTEPGQYQLKIVVDPDDDYLECNEENNVTSRTINVLAPRADLRVLSEYISPTSINPDANEPVNVFLSFDNVGVMDAGPFNVRVTVDDVPLGEDIRVSGLSAGRLTTVAIPAPYSSSVGGVRIIRGFVDVDNEVVETILHNNEASRAIIVGDAPNLLFTSISLSNQCPETGETISISASILNEGKVSAQAQVHFFYIAGQDTIPIDFVNITAGPDEVVNSQIEWTVVNPEYIIYAEIMNASPQEYNLLDNSIDISFCTEPVVNFALSTQVQGQGIITTNPQQTVFVEGTQIQVNATAASGWYFSHWEGDLTGSEAEESLTMDANKAVKAVFLSELPITYFLTLEASPEGAGTVSGAGEYEAGEELSVFASASEGYTFVSWTREGVLISEAANFTYTMPAEDVTLVANFEEIVVEPETFVLTLLALPEGAGTLTGDGEYEAGTEVQVSASASEGFTFVSWTLEGEVISEDENFTYTMPAENVTLVANFEEVIVEPETFMLTLEASPEGAGTVSGAGEYEAGEEVSVFASASEGFTFVSWTREGVLISEVANFTYTMPAEDVKLVANFEEIVVEPETFVLTLLALPEGAGTLTGDGEYEAGEELSVFASASEGFTFVSWTLEGEVISEDENFTYTMPAENVTLVANFEEVIVEPETFMLTLEASPLGAGTLTGAGEYEAGEEVAVFASASEGFTFVSWTLVGEVISEDENFTYTMPAENVTLVANFEEVIVEPETFMLTLEASPLGAGTLTGAGEYEAGEEAMLSAEASEGFTFVSWTRDGEIISAAADFSFTMPAENVTLVANFEEVIVEPETFMLTLQASPEDAGIVIGGGEYEAGTMIQLEAVANDGYYFLNWSWNQMIISASEQFQFIMPAGDVTVVAHFMREVLPGYCALSQGYWFAKPDVVWPFDVVVGGRTFTQQQGQEFWPSNTPLQRAFTQYAAVVLSEVILSEFPELLAAMQVIDHYFATTYPRNPNGNVNKAAGYIGNWISGNLCYEEIEISEAEYQEPVSGSMLLDKGAHFDLNVFPNPFRDRLNFRFAPTADTQVRLELFDMTGALVEVVFEGSVQANQLVELQYVPQLRNTSFLFYRLNIGTEVQTGKVMYQR